MCKVTLDKATCFPYKTPPVPPRVQQQSNQKQHSVHSDKNFNWDAAVDRQTARLAGHVEKAYIHKTTQGLDSHSQVATNSETSIVDLQP